MPLSTAGRLLCAIVLFAAPFVLISCTPDALLRRLQHGACLITGTFYLPPCSRQRARSVDSNIRFYAVWSIIAIALGAFLATIILSDQVHFLLSCAVAATAASIFLLHFMIQSCCAWRRSKHSDHVIARP